MKNIRQHVLKPTWQKTKNSYELHFPFEASDLGVTARKRDSKMLHLKSTRIVKIRERNLKKCKRFQNKKRWRTMNKKPIPWCFLPFPLWHLPMLLSIKKTQRWSTLIIIIMPPRKLTNYYNSIMNLNWIGVLIYEIVDCNYLKVDNMVKNSDGWCLLSWTATITTIQKLSLTSLEPQTLYLCKSWP